MARPAPAPAPRVTAFYARVTSEESVRKDLSLPNQRARFDEIARGSGWETEAFVEDAAVSGELGPSHRPALRALLASLRAGRIDRVVVRHLDRLGRGTVLEEIIAVLRDQGVELWTFDGRQDIRSAAGRLGVRAQAMVGAFEVERTGERVREMKRQKARAGYYIGPTPFGFTTQARLARELAAVVGPEQAKAEAQRQIPVSGHLYVDPAEAEVVREVYRLYLDEGLGCRRIAHVLNERGLRTRLGFLWSSQQVLEILRDPKLAGFVTFDEEAYAAGMDSRAPVWEQTLYPGKHDAIVTRELWDRVQERRNEGGRRLRSRAASDAVHALRGVVRCAHGHPAKSRSGGIVRGHTYYTCARRCLRGPDPAKGGCDAPAVHVDIAEGAVRDVLTRLLSDPSRLHGYLQAAQSEARKVEPPPAPRGVEDELRQVEAARQRYYRLLEDAAPGTAAETTALERIVELKRRIAELRAVSDPAPAVVALPAAVTLDQVRAWVGGMRGKLQGEGFQQLVATLGAEHDLRVDLLGDRRVRVSLAVDPKAVGTGPRLVATATPRVPLTAEGGVERVNCNEWAERERAKGHLCACGCGNAIPVKPIHRWKGLPRFIQGHHRMDMTAFVEAIRAEGFLTVSEAAARLGVGETTLRRAEERGWVAPERRSWGGREPMRLYRADALPGLRERLAAARGQAS